MSQEIDTNGQSNEIVVEDTYENPSDEFTPTPAAFESTLGSRVDPNLLASLQTAFAVNGVDMDMEQLPGQGVTLTVQDQPDATGVFVSDGDYQLEQVTTGQPAADKPMSKGKKRKHKKSHAGLVTPEAVDRLQEHFREAPPKPLAALLASKAAFAAAQRVGFVQHRDVDGRDYLNINAIAGETEIGKALDPFSRAPHPLVLEGVGSFQCIAGILYALSSDMPAEDASKLGSYFAGKLTKMVSTSRIIPNPGMMSVLAHAYWMLISENPHIAEGLKATGYAPIRSYYYDHEQRLRHSRFELWLVPVISACREALIEGYDYPNFGIEEDDVVPVPTYNKPERNSRRDNRR